VRQSFALLTPHGLELLNITEAERGATAVLLPEHNRPSSLPLFSGEFFTLPGSKLIGSINRVDSISIVD